MKEDQVEAAFAYAAEGLSPLFHMTAEELEHLLKAIVALDLCGRSFFDLIGAVCKLDDEGLIHTCRRFAPESSTTTPESPPAGTTTPSTTLFEACRGLDGSELVDCLNIGLEHSGFFSVHVTGAESA